MDLTPLVLRALPKGPGTLQTCVGFHPHQDSLNYSITHREKVRKRGFEVLELVQALYLLRARWGHSVNGSSSGLKLPARVSRPQQGCQLPTFAATKPWVWEWVMRGVWLRPQIT